MKILLAEAEHRTGQLLKTALLVERHIVDWVRDGTVTVELANRGEYDLLLVDLNLPKIDGITVCRQMRQRGVSIPILILTDTALDRDWVNALDSGADDLFEKFRSPCCLTAKVRVLMRRPSYRTLHTLLPYRLLTWGELSLDPFLMQVNYRQQTITLRCQEYHLLELFLSYPNRLFTRRHVIDRLWSIDDCPSEAAVTNLVKDLRRRLKATGIKEKVIETVYGMGYRLKQFPAEQLDKPNSATVGNRQLSTGASWIGQPILAAGYYSGSGIECTDSRVC